MLLLEIKYWEWDKYWDSGVAIKAQFYKVHVSQSPLTWPVPVQIMMVRNKMTKKYSLFHDYE